MPGRSFFVGKVVVMSNDFEKNCFYEMDETNGLNGTVSVKTKNTDKEVLLTAPHNKTCALVQRLLEALKIDLEIKVG